jgi:hypothetical protein
LALIGAPKGSDSDLRRSENKTPAGLAATQAKGEANDWARAKARTDANGGPTPVTKETRLAARDADIISKARMYGVKPPQMVADRQIAREEAQKQQLVDKVGGAPGSGVPKSNGGLNGAREAASAFEQTHVGKELKSIGDNGPKLHEYITNNWGKMSVSEKKAVRNYIGNAPHITQAAKAKQKSHIDAMNALESLFSELDSEKKKSGVQASVPSLPPARQPLQDVPFDMPG